MQFAETVVKGRAGSLMNRWSSHRIVRECSEHRAKDYGAFQGPTWYLRAHSCVRLTAQGANRRPPRSTPQPPHPRHRIRGPGPLRRAGYRHNLLHPARGAAHRSLRHRRPGTGSAGDQPALLQRTVRALDEGTRQVKKNLGANADLWRSSAQSRIRSRGGRLAMLGEGA